MKRNYEGITCDDVEYGIVEAIVPGFALRHLPRILREPDRLVRNYEIGVNVVFNVTQLSLYALLISGGS